MSRPVPGGRVYLVGAGPGDPELLTLRAAAVLAAAGAVFHDRLVSGEVLGLAPAEAELVDVGHRAGEAAPDLDLVAAEMADRARRGAVVVRLKGGDPFVFGRGFEELQRLWELGIPWEVVPGLSSALAAPAAAGIPVTHRGAAASVAIVAGHRRTADWPRLRADTTVVLMGSSCLDELSRGMVAAGWDPSTPAALVAAATTPRQHQVCAPLGHIARAARAAAVGTPAVLVVGAVAALPALVPTGGVER
ncbi:MAG TPA: uroporphyrinogen-III C-methyltransferase [Candidatus Dormibacteraeota bacterium]|nr:uroporphyrinogen-III C-methyltransferase [Candidatus Dormibacteraeota bacterium]